MIVRTYREGDALGFNLRDGDDFGLNSETIDQAVKSGSAITIEKNGVPVALGGIYLVWPGVGTLWMQVSDGMRGHGYTLVKTCREFIDINQEVHKLRRIQCMVLESQRENSKFIELLGFGLESRLRCAGPDGGDAFMYARIYDAERRTTKH